MRGNTDSIKACSSLCLILLVFTVRISSQSGTVLDSATGEPLKGAVVALKSTGTLMLTDENGKFSFSGNPVLIGKENVEGALPLIFSRKGITLHIAKPKTPVTIVLYSVNGKKISTVADGTFDIGAVHFTLTSKVWSSNVCVVKIRAGDQTKSYSLLVTPTFIATPEPRLSGTKMFATARVLENEDTLVVSKYGYTSVLQQLSENVTVRLTKPDESPPPPGMKSIPGGTFMMGASNPNKYEHNEIPRHQVTLSPFYMDSTEVTQADYALLTEVEPWTEYSPPNRSVKYPGKGNYLPAWFLTWDDAVLYCNARSRRDGLDTVYSWSSLTGVYGSDSRLADVKIDYTRNGYRLPTEAEWEYAARAGTELEYYWPVGEIAEKYACFDTTGPMPVAGLLPNEFGLYDMVGNVFELINDFFGSYSDESQTDPHGPESGTERCKRGGGWDADLISTCRIARRLGASPRTATTSQGFRVVLPGK